jgi:uncharacterized membrane-anchored protein YjiN (DUF445 family)
VTNPDPQAIPSVTPAPARQRVWSATLLLLIMAGLFVIFRLLPGGTYWIGLARAGTEAALVGGLADWFAVVALFRHPLGIPIPHTAVIPRNKNRIGKNLGEFVERNFLDPNLIGDRLKAAEPSAHLGRWLATPANADWLAERFAGSLPMMLDALHDRALRSFISDALKRQLSGFDMAPLLGRGLRLLRDNDVHHELFDRFLAGARVYVTERRDTVLAIVAEKTAWWVPRQVDRRVAEALVDGVIDLLDDLKGRDHEVRHQFEAAFAKLLDDLEHNPETRARIAQWQRDLMNRPEIERYLEQLWQSLHDYLERDLALPDSLVRGGLSQALQSLGTALQRDEAIRARLDERLVTGARSLVVPWRRQIGQFIADVVASWDGQTVSNRLEGAVGRDLQYIRINGTLVGALVGCVLYVMVEALF